MRRVHLLRAADGLASAMAQYAVPLLIYQVTGSVGWAGVAWAAEWGPRLVGIAVGGPVVDRVDPRLVMLSAGVVRALVVAAGVGALLNGAGPVVIVAVGVGCGLVAPVGYLAAESLGAAVGRGADGARVQAVQTAIDQGVLLAGPLLGGVLLLAGPYAGFSVVVGLSLVAGGLALLVHGVPQLGGGPARTLRRGLRRGAAALRAAPALCWMTTGLAGMNLLAGIMAAAAPVLVASAGGSSAATGVVWSASAAAALLSAVVCGWLLGRAGPRPVIVTASFTAAVAAAGAALSAGYGQLLTAMVVLGAAEGAAMVAMRTVRARLLPEDVFGSGVAVMILVLLAPMPLGGVLLAVVGEQGLPLLLTAAAAFHLLLTWACARGLLRHRRSLDQTSLTSLPSGSCP